MSRPTEVQLAEFQTCQHSGGRTFAFVRAHVSRRIGCGGLFSAPGRTWFKFAIWGISMYNGIATLDKLNPVDKSNIWAATSLETGI